MERKKIKAKNYQNYYDCIVSGQVEASDINYWFQDKDFYKWYLKKKKINSRAKIYERNPNTGVIRWRYVGESPNKFGWPNYGRILNAKTS